MTHKKLPISPELILSHYWAASAKPRLAVMYQSLNTLLDKIGNPEIKPNDFTIIERLLPRCYTAKPNSRNHRTTMLLTALPPASSSPGQQNIPERCQHPVTHSVPRFNGFLS